MSTHLLLLGAGFSRNWGGSLASEVIDRIIADDDVRDDAEIVELLDAQRNGGGFEAALAALRADAGTSARARTLENAVERVFARMNDAFYRLQFDFSNQREHSMAEFLARFDAIFSLLQDLLLDHHYVARNGALTASGQRFQATVLPGVPIPPGLGPLPQDWAAARFRVRAPEIGKRCQPLFKLHGSVQWRDADDSSVLVLGAAKRETIAAHPTLTWYFAEFERRLVAPDTRLMIIGYGFGDEHVNCAIAAGVAAGLRIFIIDPAGVGAADRGGAGFASLLKRAARASRRPLSTTFSTDTAEFAEVMRFFA